MWNKLLLIGTLVLFGCTGGMQKIDDCIFVHDNSSKVWLVQKQLRDGKDYTPMRFEFKEIIIFHASKNAYFHRIIDLGKVPGRKKVYWMDREKDEFGFYGDKKEFLFTIAYLSRTKMVLKPKNKSYGFTLVLIPFPEY